jgi:hypothetical protein
MTTADETDGEVRPIPAWRQPDLLALVWIPIGLLLLAGELVAIRLVPSTEDDATRAVAMIGATLLHALAILLGTLLVVGLPRDRLAKLRRALARTSVAIFGLAGLATHGWALWVILARVEAPKVGWIRLDPIVDAIGGLWLAGVWLVFLALATPAAWIGVALGRRRDRA